MRKNRLLRATVLAVACSLSMAVSAQSGVPKAIDIPPGDLVSSLQALIRQSGAEFVYREDLLAGLRTQGVRGTLTAEQALEKLLEGSGFAVKRDPSGALMIIKSGTAVPEAEPQAATRSTPTAAQSAELEPEDLEKITVTGTRIRGGTSPSPVIIIGIENIREEGFTDLGEVIRSIPQNFGGGQNPGVVAAVGSGNTYNQNVTGGSSLNLRGAGADATLTLLNGRRRSYGGLYDSVDISAIPVEAVDRIEIVADGASAIYGSDAIAGVGNVILRRDFEGVMLGTRYGTTADGGLGTREYSGTTGAVWRDGGLIASAKRVIADPVDVSDRRYTATMAGPNTLYPGSELWSGLLSGHHSLGEMIELRLDVLRSRRTQRYYQRYPAFWYDNRTADTAELVSSTVEFALPGSWTLSLGGTWSQDENEYEIWTVMADSGDESLARRACNCNESRSYEISGEGPLFSMNGGDARLAVGAGYRTNDYLNAMYSSGVMYSGVEASRYGYGEISLPLVGASSGAVGAERVVLTAALRGEDYDNFGSVVTPKLGMVLRTGTDFTTKVSWGRSFKAPMLSRRYGNRFVYLAPASLAGGTDYPEDSTLLITWGANPDLEPERARTLTASLAFHPQALPGLEMELTWFDIDYEDRVLAPLGVLGQALSNPVFADFVEYAPTEDRQAALLAAYDGDLQNISGAAYDPGRVVAIAYNNYTNALRQQIRGVDLSGSWRFDLGPGRLTVRGAASWLDSTQQNTAGQRPFDLSGTIFYPANVTGRLGAVWNNGGFTGSVFANYTDGVRNHLTGDKGGSFTTLDATLRYTIDTESGRRAGWDLVLAGQNLFNRPPPLYTPAVARDVPYDSTNYSAIGRFLSVSVARRW